MRYTCSYMIVHMNNQGRLAVFLQNVIERQCFDDARIADDAGDVLRAIKAHLVPELQQCLEDKQKTWFLFLHIMAHRRWKPNRSAKR